VHIDQTLLPGSVHSLHLETDDETIYCVYGHNFAILCRSVKILHCQKQTPMYRVRMFYEFYCNI